MTLCWTLLDHRPGTANQVIGLARATGFTIVEKHLEYNRLAQLPNALHFYGLMGLIKASRVHIRPPWPDVVIAAGRRAAPVAHHIKRTHTSTKLVHLMHPELPLSQFDLIILPQHDGTEERGNIVTSFGAPHLLTDTLLFEARARLPLNPDIFPKPWTMLALGGNTPHGSFRLSDALHLVQLLAPLAHEGGTLLLTPSRRTPHALLRAVMDEFAKLYPLTRMHVYHIGQEGENPYHAWLAQADRCIVTADSISMVSEAAFVGKPLYLYAPRDAMSDKHRSFMQAMIESDYARSLQDIHPLWVGGLRLDEASRLARNIINLIQ
ncbi:MAG: hypothetical protein EAZ74_00810 [Alphaproteobacteria bacterium]|nr:MAG: hypothetical protein EAY76_01975 [Alphaproteobacteria bacterium]TAF15847.1 MAG: hypothetical protein EAZ74_00810 [Alphaproteobacteria bacterium]TAF41122.1 MAG: hypothetical protein EAZ66_01870 [Alphaproteobacteria bacterium]TAF77255.1 MAG: hypothetical protein EAZ52_01605 [Alphaproteobacteria bacterium]